MLRFRIDLVNLVFVTMQIPCLFRLIAVTNEPTLKGIPELHFIMDVNILTFSRLSYNGKKDYASPSCIGPLHWLC